MKTEYNKAAFTPEDVEKGLHNDLIQYLLSYNQKSTKHFYDIHITSDGYCTIVEWIDRDFDYLYDSGRFDYLEEDESIMSQRKMPDNTYVWVHDDEEYQELLRDYNENLEEK